MFFNNRKQLKPNKHRFGLSLIEVIAVVIISGIITITLGAVYVYFVDSWNRAQAQVELYEAAASLYRMLYMGIAEYGGGAEGGIAVKWARKVTISDYKRCNCPEREQGNRVEVECPRGNITFYHSLKDSAFYCEYLGDRIPLIPSKDSFGGDLEGRDHKQDRTIYVDQVCFWLDKDSEGGYKGDLLHLSYILENNYGEKIQFNSAIFLRNYKPTATSN